MFQVWDVIFIPIGELFTNVLQEREQILYTPRERIYAVVAVHNATHNFYFMRWAIEGLLNITEAEWEVLNDQIFYQEELELVRSWATPKSKTICTSGCSSSTKWQDDDTTTGWSLVTSSTVTDSVLAPTDNSGCQWSSSSWIFIWWRTTTSQTGRNASSRIVGSPASDTGHWGRDWGAGSAHAQKRRS